jgi:hypothetical protein
MLDVFFAFAAGVLTIAAPCVLPIVLGATIGRTDPARPIFITIGFAITFALGGIMRVRKAIYEEARKFRAKGNGRVIKEPREMASFKD